MQKQFWQDEDEDDVPKPTTSALSPIINLMDRAGEHLKWPKIRFGKMTMVRTRFGTVGLKMKDSNTKWVGFIQRDGTLSERHCLSENLVTFLEAFAKDPAKYATIYGIKTGACSFCGRELTDPRSVTVGYGPICAEHYGLPWGEADFVNAPKSIQEVENGV